jgi:hypothetical protein
MATRKKKAKKRAAPSKRKRNARKIRPSKARLRKAAKMRQELQATGAAAVAVLRERGFTAHYRTFMYQGGTRATLDVNMAPTGERTDLIELEAAMMRPAQAVLEILHENAGNPKGAKYRSALELLKKVTKSAPNLSAAEKRRVLAAGRSGNKRTIRAQLGAMPGEEAIPEDAWLAVGARVDIQTVDGELTDSPTIDRGGDTLWSHAAKHHPSAFISSTHVLGNSMTKIDAMGGMVSMSDIIGRATWTYDGKAPVTPKR